MNDEIFADVPSEGATLEIDKAFERLSAKGDKTASASQPEKKETDKPSQKGENTPVEQTPFHKHPRWIKTQETLKSYETRLAEYEKKLKDVESKADVTLPDWWKTANGDTSQSKERYRSYLEATKSEVDRLAETVQKNIEAKTLGEQKDITDANEYVDTQIDELHEEGRTFEKNELLKFMVDFQAKYGSQGLLDADGNYDFRKALNLKEEFQPKEPVDTTTRRQLASNSNRSKVSAGNQNSIPSVSRRALRQGNWRDAI